MSYIGNTPTTQSFTPAIDYFSGNGSSTAFTLSRQVASVAQVQVTISNVPQTPGVAYTVSGNTITFTSAPPTGTSNIYVYYTSPVTQVISPGQQTVGTTQLSATGTPSSSTYLRGDNTWSTISTGLPGVLGQAFTTTGSGQTFTIPTGVTALKVTVVGAGGGGGGGQGSVVCGSNLIGSGTTGGAGGVAVSYLSGLTSGATLTVTVGAGGSGASSTTASTGGTSSVASGTQTITTITATGGGGGTSNGGTAGSPGTASGGALNFGGGYNGLSGCSVFGYAGKNGGMATNGSTGGNYGGGGGYGTSPAGSGSATGGAGAAGVVIFEW